MKQLHKFLLLSLLGILFFSQNIFGQLVKDTLLNFQIPNHWDTIPRSILDYQTNLMNEQSGQNVKYKYGIFKLDTDGNRTYPYILIQFIPVENISKYKFDEIAKKISKEFGKTFTQLEKDFSFYMDSLTKNEMLVDKEKERLISITTMSLTEIGQVKDYSVFKPIASGLLAFHCYSFVNDFDKDINKFNYFIENIEIKDKYEFKSSFWNDLNYDTLTVAVLIGLFGIFFKKIFKRKKKK